MKAFEKWNNKNPAYIPLLENTIKAERAKSWRAALEWTLKQSDELNTSAIGLDVVTLQDLIDKELEN